MGYEPFIGEISLFGFGFVPQGWAACDGRLLSISSNTALFSLLGTTYGGNGQTTFALPDLRGRVPVGFGQGPGLSSHDMGQVGGAEQVTAAARSVAPPAPSEATAAPPARSAPPPNAAGHTHPLVATAGPAGAVTLSVGAAVGGTGEGGTLPPQPAPPPPTPPPPPPPPLPQQSQPIPTQSPYLALNWCIAVQGIYPSRT